MSFLPQSHKDHGVSQSVLANDLTGEIVDCAYKIHKTIGPGLLESAYHECMVMEFEKRNIPFKSEYEAPLFYDGQRLKTPYRIDLIVDEKVVVELKSVEKLLPIHEGQTLTYLKLSGLRLALLINFSAPLIKDGIRRFIL